MASIAQPRIHAPALPRPKAAPSGLWSWLTTVDHKRIAVLYGVTAFIFFLVGGLEALLIRAQLTRPENNIVDAQRYNELFTMHGTTMIFLVVMPLSVALFNLVVPLQLGARDVAFPRLNGFSYWTFLAGAAILNIPVLFALPEVFIRIAGVAWTNFFGSGLLTTVKTFFDFWPFPWFNVGRLPNMFPIRAGTATRHSPSGCFRAGRSTSGRSVCRCSVSPRWLEPSTSLSPSSTCAPPV